MDFMKPYLIRNYPISETMYECLTFSFEFLFCSVEPYLFSFSPVFLLDPREPQANEYMREY